MWSYYAYFVAVVLNAMTPSPAEQVHLLIKPLDAIFDKGDLCRCIPLFDRPVRLVLCHGRFHSARLCAFIMASQPGSGDLLVIDSQRKIIFPTEKVIIFSLVQCPKWIPIYDRWTS